MFPLQLVTHLSGLEMAIPIALSVQAAYLDPGLALCKYGTRFSVVARKLSAPILSHKTV